MEQPFLFLYRFFNRNKPIFWITFLTVTILLLAGASRVKLEEDITKFFPDDERVEKLNYIFKYSKLSERLVAMVSVADSATTPDPDQLVAYAESLADSINRKLSTHLSGINVRVDDT